jgi:hypothetical protein
LYDEVAVVLVEIGLGLLWEEGGEREEEERRDERYGGRGRGRERERKALNNELEGDPICGSSAVRLAAMVQRERERGDKAR